jgi:ribose transport system substrate-binding protein
MSHSRRRSVMYLLVAGLAGAVAVAAASAGASRLAANPASTYTGPESKLPKGYPVPTLKAGLHPTVALEIVANNESGVGEADGAKAQAKKLGINLKILYDNATVDTQVSNMNTAIADKVNAIILYPLDPSTLGPELAKAQAAGIKVFAVDATKAGQPLDKAYVSTILFNRDEAAYLQVQEMSQLKPHAKIVVMNFAGPVAALHYYMSRVRFYAKQAGLTILGEQDNATDDVAGGQTAMNVLLGKYPSIDGIIAYNDPSALGAEAAARAAGRSLIAIGQNGGSDARAGVASGQEAASIFVNTPAQAAQFLNGIYDLMENPKTVLPRVVAVPPGLITKATLNSVPSYDSEVSKIENSKGLAVP